MRRNKRPTCIIQRFQHMFISASHSTLHVSSLVWELIFSVVPSFEPIHWALHFTDFSSFFKFITFLKTESSEVFFPHNVLLLSHSYIPDVSAALGRAHVISDLRKHIIHLCTREHFPIKDTALKESSKLVSVRKKMKEAKISLAIWQYLENLC